MEAAQSNPYRHTCIDAGVDWITATCAGKGSRSAFEALGDQLLQTATAAGVEIQPAAVRDYVGWKAPGIMAGRRREDSIIILTSTYAARQWKSVAQLSTNVSRFDLQATVWTHGEQPALSRWYWMRYKRQQLKRGRPRKLRLIQEYPQGDTLYVNKRISDYFGRIYDFAAAHAQGEARTLWRFEVEIKRHLAARHCAALLLAASDRMASESVVAEWYKSRGFQPSWSTVELLATQDVPQDKTERDTLGWFETSVSKTVARAIRRHGLAAVLDALHLSDVVIPKPRRR